MENTFTFTARSAKNSTHVATFTLHDDQMDIDIGTSLVAAEKTLHRDGTAMIEASSSRKSASWSNPLQSGLFSAPCARYTLPT